MPTRIPSSVVTLKIQKLPPKAVEPSVSWRSASRPSEAGMNEPAIAMAGPHPGIFRRPPSGQETPREKKIGSATSADRTHASQHQRRYNERDTSPRPQRPRKVPKKPARRSDG